jgi:alkylation response protein AidB-like acyl-CoA dehydrogenase
VNGQKVWTSNAMHGDMLFALVRTSAEENRHRGLSMLLIDMRADGVEVRPLKQLSGSEDFGEVFLTDARVPKENVLGDVGDGWRVAMLLLSFERGASGIGQYRAYRRELDEIVDLARSIRRRGRPAVEDETLRQQIAASVVELECLRLHSLRILTEVEQGNDLGAQSSVTKLQWSEAHQDIGELFADVTGMRSQVGDPTAPLGLDPLQLSYLWSRSETIWGGSSQVQRNIVAERVLGLPR